MHFRGPWTPFGLSVALAVFILDRAHKGWMLGVYDIAEKSRVKITSFFDLVLVWNRGISYGLFQQESAFGRFLLILFVVAVIAVLLLWLAAAHGRVAAAGLGLIVGGAASNLVDRLAHGAVADFFHFHIGGYSWYVFNIADAAIVAGVAALLYDSAFGRHKSASNEG